MSYEFNGTNQRLNTPTGSAVIANLPITMACWFNADIATAEICLMAMASDWANWVGGGLYMVASGSVTGDPVRILTNPNASDVATTTSGFTVGTWHHAAGVFTSTSSRTVYLDGGNSATTTTTYNLTSPTDGMRVGQFTNNFPRYFDGKIADVGVWDAALTAAEIASLAKGMTCNRIRPQNLQFYAPLVRDLSDVRKGVTITNLNTATVADHPRVY